MKRDRRSEKVYLPSSHDIEQACERIQAGWTERERLKRAGWVEGRHWSPPLVDSETLFPDGFGRTMDPQIS